MEEHAKRATSLSLVAERNLLPVATSFVENSALALGLGRAEALGLTLASEEIFSYLCQTASRSERLSINCSQGGSCVKAEFSLPKRDLNLRAFNLAATATTLQLDEDSDLDEMGLLIASRSVDHFHIVEEIGAMRLILVKEKKYPGIEPNAVKARPLESFSIRAPDSEALKLFAHFVDSCCRDCIVPLDLKYPGKLVDMVAAGECSALLAFDREGHVGGGILWRWAGAKIIECLGPYVFGQPPGSPIANELLEGCIKATAKSGAIGIINRLPTTDFPIDHFEPLGNLTFFDQNGAAQQLPAYFRQMEEDPGLVVWCHPQLLPWLKREYERLVFPRDVQTATDAGETVGQWSVLSAESDRFNRMATLRPIRFGADANQNLAAHIALLQKESFQRIFFEMDLGAAWQTRFAPALIDCGFQPRLVLPYAGAGDLVVFQWEAAR